MTNAEIDGFPVSRRTYNTLNRAGVTSLSQIESLGEMGLCRIPRLGRKTYAEIQQLMTASRSEKSSDRG